MAKLKEGVTATDLVLTVTQMLRKKGVVDKFVEFYRRGSGEHVADGPRHDRQHGTGVWRDDGLLPGGRGDAPLYAPDRSLRGVRSTAPRPTCALRVSSAKPRHPSPEFTDTLELDLGSVVPSLAGPKRPQDRVALSDMKDTFRKALTAPVKERGYELSGDALTREAVYGTPTFGTNGGAQKMKHGAVVIAAITSCTNTSNPSVLVAAGLVAKKAVEKGLTVKPYVKTSLAPGSRVVTEYLQAGRPDRTAVQTRFQRHRLWLHHLHRQLRSAAGRGGQGCDRLRPGRGGGHLRQPQLRRARPPAGQGQLPGLAAAGGRLCPGRDGGHRPDQRTARHRHGRQAGLPQGSVAHPAGDQRSGRRPASKPGCSRRSMRSVFDGSEMWKEIKVTDGDLYRVGRDIHLHSSPALFPGISRWMFRSIKDIRTARVSWACSAIRSPPIISRLPATSPRIARQGNSCRSSGVQPTGLQLIRHTPRQ